MIMTMITSCFCNEPSFRKHMPVQYFDCTGELQQWSAVLICPVCHCSPAARMCYAAAVRVRLGCVWTPTPQSDTHAE